jgi:predicted nucleotidyltransferase
MNRLQLSTLLKRLHSDLGAIYGDEIHAVYLYGSQARGEAHPDSDVDILVILRDEFDYFNVVEKTSHITSALSLEYETVISCVFVTQRDFEQRQTPLLLNVRREGIPI